MVFLSLFFHLKCKVVHYLDKCKICVQVGFINLWDYWYFTIAGLTTCKMFYHPILVNQAKVFLEILLCGAEEESTSLFSPLYFPSQFSDRWHLLSEEPISANSGGQIAAELCEMFLFFPPQYFQSLLTKKVRKQWQLRWPCQVIWSLCMYSWLPTNPYKISQAREWTALLHSAVTAMQRSYIWRKKDLLGVKWHNGWDEQYSPDCITCTFGDKSA